MRKAFTLVELLVVISIIGLLATVAVVSLSTVRGKARDTKRVADLREIQQAIESFNAFGGYPYPSGGPYYLGVGETPANSCRGGVVCKSLCYDDATGFDDVCDVGGITFVASLPKAPTPPDGTCSADDNKYVYRSVVTGGVVTGYKLTTCLGSKVGSLGPGVICATQNGLDQGAACL